MKTKSTMTVLVAALAVLSGAMGLTISGAFSDQGITTAYNKNVAVGLMTGHLEIEAHRANGELFAYRQFDNAVVDDGERCILKLLFATSGEGAAGRGQYASTSGAGSGGCTGALTGAWDIIAIGTGTGGPAETDVKLTTEITANGGERGMATEKTWSNSTGGIPQIILKKTFTNTSSDIGGVTESGLFNSTTVNGSGMLARNTFDAVNLTVGDSITITWTFKVGDA